MKNIKLVIEYDGTNYNGWQSQKNGLGIEDVIKKGIGKIADENVKLIGSGRTDAGVHALGQVANFFTGSSIPPERFALALNTRLPRDIVIKESSEADPGFHSRFSAKKKTYRYDIYNSRMPSALLFTRACHVPEQLDMDKMKAGAQDLLGTHDFNAFRAQGSYCSSTIRTVHDIRIESKGQVISIYVTGDGFLYNMVRIIAGTLVYVGIGKLKPSDISYILTGRNRVYAGKTMPPHGLYLLEVFY